MAKPHDVILARVARRVLGAAGCRQKGKSRLWFDDRGWHLTLVEFQPRSGGAQGTYLNVGTMWLWYPSDHFAFNTPAAGESTRVATYVQFFDEPQYERDVTALAATALLKVEEIRQRFATIEATRDYLMARPRRSVWDRYFAGIACALAGDPASATEELTTLIATEAPYPWQQALRATAADLVPLLAAKESLRSIVDGYGARTRASLKIPSP